MSTLLESVREKAKKARKHIVLAEGEEERIIRAAGMIVAEKIAKVTLIGNRDVISEKCPSVDLSG